MLQRSFVLLEKAHLEAGIHQDVHVGAAADGSFLTSSLWSGRQEQTAGRGQSGIWGRLS